MSKKLIVLLAVALALVCVFTACKSKGETNDPTGSDPGQSTAKYVETIAVSETQYQFVTNADGSFVTVAVTDADGVTHYYLQGVKAGAADPSGAEAPATVTVTDAQGEPVMVTDVEGQSVVATETVPAAAASDAPVQNTELIPIAKSAIVDQFVDMLNGGRFGIYGKMTSEGESIPITFLKNGDDIRMSAEMSGIALDMASIGGKMYLISNERKSYIELTDSIMDTLGLDISQLDLDFGEVATGNELVEDDGQYNGKAVKIYTSTAPEGILKFYVDGDKIAKIEMYDLEGICHTMIETSNVRGDITAADIAIPGDFEKKSYVSFIADIMGDMPNN
ncbi:MAG: hypothetical protein IJL26_12955 [Clostridia bacterium]|nr:hypothetical protein [Clostridia bacterium]